jgi:hypothetical protein
MKAASRTKSHQHQADGRDTAMWAIHIPTCSAMAAMTLSLFALVLQHQIADAQAQAQAVGVSVAPPPPPDNTSLSTSTSSVFEAPKKNKNKKKQSSSSSSSRQDVFVYEARKGQLNSQEYVKRNYPAYADSSKFRLRSQEDWADVSPVSYTFNIL